MSTCKINKINYEDVFSELTLGFEDTLSKIQTTDDPITIQQFVINSEKEHIKNLITNIYVNQKKLTKEDQQKLLENISGFYSVIEDDIIKFSLREEAIAKIISDIVSKNTKQNIAEEQSVELELPKLSDKGLDPQFLNEYFKHSMGTKVEVAKRAKALLAKAILFNREKGTLVQSKEQLNKNLRNLQEQLWKTVLENFNSDKITGYSQVQRINHEDGSYTPHKPLFPKNDDHLEILPEYETIRKQLRKAFNELYGDLPSLYQAFSKKNNNSEDEDPKTKLYRAYTSFIMLDNFDNLVHSILGKNISIDNPGVLSLEDKYSLSAKGENHITSWSDEDVVNWEKHIENTSRLLIESTNIIENGKIVPNKYLKVNEFAAVFSSIKEASLKFNWFQIDLWNNDFNFPNPLYNLLIVNQKMTLGELIGIAVENPGYWYPLIFEFLKLNINHEKLVDYKKSIGLYGIDLINTIYENFFNPHKSKLPIFSLLRSSQTNKNSRLYDGLMQLSSSTSPVNLVQRYLDPNGVFQNRTFEHKSIDARSKNFKERINRINSYSIQMPHLDQYVDPMYTPEITENSFSIQFLIPYNTTKVTTNANSSDVIEYVKVHYRVQAGNETITIGEGKQNLNYANEQSQILLAEFLDNVLGVRFREDGEFSKLYEVYKSQITSGISLNHDLGNLALKVMARALYRKVLLNKKQTTETKLSLWSDMAKVYPNIRWDSMSHAVNLIMNADLPNLIIYPQIQELYDGSFARSIVKDGENNAQSRFTKSRMASQLQNQFSKIKQNEGNAAHDFSLIDNVIGIYNVKETQSADGEVRKTTEQNLGELFYGQFFLDFIASFVHPENSRNLVKEGQVAVYGATASDKSSFFNVLYKLPKGYNTMNQEDRINYWEQLRSKETSRAYQITYNNVENVWMKISQVIDDFQVKESYTVQEVMDFINEHYDKPVEAALSFVRKYNTKHPQDHIQLFETLMYEKVKQDGKTRLIENRSLKYYAEQGDFNHEQYVKAALDIADTLYKEGVIFNVNNTTSPEIEFLKDQFKDPNGNFEWVDENGNIIWAKKVVDSLGIETKIPNPFLLEWNVMGSVISEQFKYATVGTSVNHAAKGSFKENEIHLMNAARINTQTKRSSALTATMDQLTLQSLNGVPSKVKVAVLDEILDTQSNLSGDINDEVNVHDGATYGSPFFAYLVNNSLGEAAAGLTLKIYAQSYKPELGIGQNLKTALFSLRNYHLRNSLMQRRLLKKMTDIPWRQTLMENENKLDLGDQTIDQFMDNFDVTEGINRQQELYYQENGQYYQITKIYKNNNTIDEYTVESIKVDINGNIQKDPFTDSTINNNKTVRINSNYSLYQALGGWQSMSLVNNTLQYSEASVKEVVNFMNNHFVQLKTNSSHLLKVNKEAYQSQDTLFQFMKHSDIAMAATKGAIKQGIANLNSASRYYDDQPLEYMTMEMTNAGVQLDKEHFSEELSQSNQMLIASSLGGLTPQYSQNIQKALHEIFSFLSYKISDIFKDIPSMDTMTEEQSILLSNTLKEIVFEVMARDGVNPNNFLSEVAVETIKKLQTENDVNLQNILVPFSDPNIYNKAVSAITTFLNKNGIRNKLPGILGVLTPSKGYYKLYGDHMLADFEDNYESRINTVQEQKENNPVYESNTNNPIESLGDIELGRVYKIKYVEGDQFKEEYQLISTPLDRGDLLFRISEIEFSEVPVKVVEYVKPHQEINPDGGRDLASYNIKFKDVNGRSFNIYDVKELIDCFEATNNNPNITKEENLQLRHYMWQQLDKISKSKETGVPTSIQVYDNGEVTEITIDPTSIEIKPFEIIMPAVFRDRFGLKPGDSIGDIINDPDFFVNRLKENNRPTFTKHIPWDYEIKNGKHNIIISERVNEDFSFYKFKEVEVETKLVKGELWRVGPDKKLMYKLSQVETGPDNHLEFQDKIYRNENGDEIIVTSNSHFYVQDHMDSIVVSNVDVSPFNPSDAVLKKTNTFEQRLQAINENKTLSKELKQKLQNAVYLGAAYSTVELKSNQDTKVQDYIHRLWGNIGTKMHTSFLKHLEVVVGRIPSQSMQSYMAMKVVGFETELVNNLMVSATQIWLQGSDYDIDAGNVFMFKPNRRGIIDTWNIFADYSSLYTLNESMSFPWPTSKEVEVFKEPQDFGKFISNNNELIPELLEALNKNAGINFNGKENNPSFIGSLQIALVQGRFLEGKVDLHNKTLSNALKFLLKEPALVQFTDSKFSIPVDGESVELDANSVLQKLNQYNTYLLKLKDDTKKNVILNYLQYNFHKGIIDPTNQIQAQSPIDEVTKGLKALAKTNTVVSEENKKLSEFNYFSNTSQFRENHQGKDGISIAAVGTKTYGVLSYSIHKILNSGNLDEIKTLAGKHTKKFLKSIHLEGPILENLRQVDEALYYHIKDSLKSNNAIDDISAFMSLSVDNAKELALAALNAGSLTLGLYMYAISMGYDTEKVAQALMSPIGNLILDSSKGNIFTGKRNAISLESVFSDLENPVRLQHLFKSKEGRYVKKAWDAYLSKEVYAQLVLGRNTNYDYLYTTFIENFSKDIILPTSGYDNVAIKQIATQLVSIINEDFKNKKIIQEDKDNPKTGYYDLIKELYRGAEEMRSLSSILGLNNGLPSKPNEVLNKIKQIESLTKKASEAKATDNTLESQYNKGILKYTPEEKVANVDLYKFTHDPEYREQVIDEYEQKKHTFNVWRMISKIESFMDYLSALSEAHEALRKKSNKYNLIYYASNFLADVTGQHSKRGRENIYRGIGTFFTEVTRNRFFIDQNITTIIPKGQYYYGPTYKLSETPLEEDYVLQLGTAENNATFLKYFTEVVIPDLKNGVFSDDGTVDIVLRNNKFIKDLSLISYNRTGSKNTANIWTLENANLSPRTDEERAVVQDYVLEMDKLRGKQYKGHDIISLFTLYDLIMFSGRQGEASWDNLLINYKNEGLFKAFHDYESWADSTQLIEYVVPDQLSSKSERYQATGLDILPFVAPIGNIKFTNKPYILHTDPLTNETLLYRRLSQEEKNSLQEQFQGTGIEDDDVFSIPDYMVAVGRDYSGINFNHFPGYIPQISANNSQYVGTPTASNFKIPEDLQDIISKEDLKLTMPQLLSKYETYNINDLTTIYTETPFDSKYNVVAKQLLTTKKGAEPRFYTLIDGNTSTPLNLVYKQNNVFSIQFEVITNEGEKAILKLIENESTMKIEVIDVSKGLNKDLVQSNLNELSKEINLVHGNSHKEHISKEILEQALTNTCNG